MFFMKWRFAAFPLCVCGTWCKGSILRLKLSCEGLPVSEMHFTKRGKIEDSRIILEDTRFISKNEETLLAQNGTSIVKVAVLNAHMTYGSMPMHV